MADLTKADPSPPAALADVRVTAVEAVLDAWESAGITCVILHGFQRSPDPRVGRDVDVLIASPRIGDALDVAQAALERCGFDVVRPPSIWGSRLLAFQQEEWASGVEIHVIAFVAWQNVVFVDQPPLPAAGRGTSREDAWAAFAKRVLLPFLSTGGSEKALRTFPEFAVHAPLLSARLRDFAPRLHSRLLAALAAGDLQALNAIRGPLRAELRLRSLARHPFRSARLFGYRVGQRLFFRFFPCAPIVAFSGSSTFSNRIQDALSRGEPSVFNQILIEPPLNSGTATCLRAWWRRWRLERRASALQQLVLEKWPEPLRSRWSPKPDAWVSFDAGGSKDALPASPCRVPLLRLCEGRVSDQEALSAVRAFVVRALLRKNSRGRRRLARPRALHVALLGPDGSGKSSVVQGLVRQLSGTFTSVEVDHWRPALLPEVGVLLRRRRRSAGSVADPYAAPLHPPLISAARALYYLADYWLGFLLKTLPAKRAGRLVLSDRYAPDLWCDPFRYRFRLPRRFLQGLASAAPRADLSFVLLADEAALRLRKGELSSTFAGTILENYRALRGFGHLPVDATRPLEAVTAEITGIILQAAETNSELRALFPPPPAGAPRFTKQFQALHRAGKLRLLLPLAPVEAAEALSLYPAQRLLRRTSLSALRLLAQSRVSLPLPRAEFLFDPQDAFSRFLTELAPEWVGRSAGLAIHSGNPAASGRRFILLLFRHGVPTLVVKAGAAPAARELLRREESLLRSVSREGVPAALRGFASATVSALALPYFPGAPPAGPQPAAMHGLLRSWLHETPVPLGSLPLWQQLAAACRSAPEFPALASALESRSVRPALMHGDFAPWNIRVHPETRVWQVFDWERGDLSGMPAWDWIHFTVLSALLVRREKPVALRQRLEALFVSPEFQEYAREAGITGVERPLALAWLLYTETIICPAEGASGLSAFRRQLSVSWRA